LGGFLTLRFGWRSIFLVNVPLGLTIIALILSKMREEWAEAKGERFDLTGSVIYCLGVIAIMYGFTSFALLPHVVGAGLILAGSLAIVAFVWREAKVESPVLDITLFRGNRVFALSNLAALINYSATFATTFFLSLYLQYLKKFDPETAGGILVCQPVVMAICSPFAGKLSDKIEPRIVASMGMALGAVGLILLIFLRADTTLEFIIADLIILGLGMALFSSPNTNAVMSSVEKRFYGVASGTLGTMRLTGQMFSMGIAIFVFAIHLGHTQITPEYYPVFLKSMRSAFIFFGALSVVGVFASLARGKIR
jgi:MFS family permease